MTTRRSLRLNEVAGFAVVALLILAVGGWAAHAKLAGAVIASGVVAVQDNSKAVQHLEGGIIREILVTEGSLVEANSVVARLDDTQIKAKLGIIDSQMIELVVEQARLDAERDDLEDLADFDVSAEYAAEGTLERAIAGQRKHFVSLRDAIRKTKDQLHEQIAQIEAAIKGVEGKLAATKKQEELAKEELSILQSLAERGLATRNRVFAMERELAQVQGEVDDLRGSIAAQQAKIAEIQLKLWEIDDQRRTKVAERLTEIRAKLADLHEQRDFELFRLKGTAIVAPIGGRVHELRVHTNGGVVRAGDPLMMIVPSEEALTVRVRVRPEDIDRIYVGQPARLRFTAFNARTTPEIEGTVSVVGADQIVDPETKIAYFRVDIAIPPENFVGIDVEKVKPGVPVEAFVTTDQQTVATYLLRPFLDQFARAFRET